VNPAEPIEFAESLCTGCRRQLLNIETYASECCACRIARLFAGFDELDYQVPTERTFTRENLHAR
jgi:hypothetical protein